MKDTDEDGAWIATSGVDNKYQLQTINRSTRQGGGVALLHMREYQTTRIENSPLFDTVEYCAWTTTVWNKKITLLGVYHPPIGSTAGNTHIKFLDEVSQLVQYFITNHKNLVLLGDFNIHVQDLTNLNSLVYSDTVEAIGLIQHIEPTQPGNTLDLIYIESLEVVKVLHAFLGDYISNHRLAGIELQLRKQWENQSTRHRNYRGLNVDNFMKEFNNNRILEKDNLEEVFTEFKEEMTKARGEIAPLEDRGKPKRKSRPRYNSQLLEQSKVTRNRERAFNKYTEDRHWSTFTRE